MAIQKPSIPKGTRDFSPVEMTRRNYMFDTIKAVFREHGFLPLETPAMENLSTLMGKYGEEGDKLLFKILDSGDFLSDYNIQQRESILRLVEMRKKMLDVVNTQGISTPAEFMEHMQDNEYVEKLFYETMLNELIIRNILVSEEDGRDYFRYDRDTTQDQIHEIIDDIIDNAIKGTFREVVGVEKGLRYDLTVPFARYVVQHRNDITFPFRRYQVQPVWRADRPQKGRYREFYQCDVDIIGSESLLNEVELVQIVEKVFQRLGVGVTLKLNNRKILAGIAETIGHADKMTDITVAIDKLDKIGLDAVSDELRSKGIADDAIGKLKPILALSGTNREKLARMREVLAGSQTGLKGIAEMETIFDYIDALGTTLDIEIDLSLARGLNYYTGAIFEVKARDFQIGSICGGGRYDDLTGIFGMPDTSGVGISFGADRIYDVMLGLGLFPDEASLSTRAIFLNFGGPEELAALKLLTELRAHGIPSEIYPEAAKMKKQMEYTNRRGIPFAIIIGSDELAAGEATVKDMRNGEQTKVAFGSLASFLS